MSYAEPITMTPKHLSGNVRRHYGVCACDLVNHFSQGRVKASLGQWDLRVGSIFILHHIYT